MSLGVPDYSGYQRLPSWVLGFHGMDKDVAQGVLTSQDKHLEPSKNRWDWLGTGIYFWENDPKRAMQFAIEGMGGKVTRGKIKTPFVIGAIIDLGLCCNLFDQAALEGMQKAHQDLFEEFDLFGVEMPVNKGKARNLDRAVFEHMHELRARVDKLPPYQTVRVCFPEGEPLYEGAVLTKQNHIQIAVRDPSCIRGYFLPRT